MKPILASIATDLSIHVHVEVIHIVFTAPSKYYAYNLDCNSGS